MFWCFCIFFFREGNSMHAIYQNESIDTCVKKKKEVLIQLLYSNESNRV